LVSEEVYEVDEMAATPPRGDLPLQLAGVVRGNERLTPVDDSFRTGAQYARATQKQSVPQGVDSRVKGRDLVPLVSQPSHDFEDRTFARTISALRTGQTEKPDLPSADLPDQLNGVGNPRVIRTGARVPERDKPEARKVIDLC
jgi:hypothetical protein